MQAELDVSKFSSDDQFPVISSKLLSTFAEHKNNISAVVTNALLTRHAAVENNISDTFDLNTGLLPLDKGRSCRYQSRRFWP